MAIVSCVMVFPGRLFAALCHGDQFAASVKLRHKSRARGDAMKSVQIFPLAGLPEVSRGDDLVRLIVSAVRAQDLKPQDHDVFVIAQKIVSKSEGRSVRLDSIAPSDQARAWAKDWGKDARVIQLVLSESKRIVRMERGVIISETRHGFVCANAGVDVSNAPEGAAI